LQGVPKLGAEEEKTREQIGPVKKGPRKKREKPKDKKKKKKGEKTGIVHYR